MSVWWMLSLPALGASDDLAAGQSTFMVEMNEVAEMQRAPKSSLVILDGDRPRHHLDGMSIARAVVEYICDNIGCKTLFATHYHELTSMEQDIHGVKNYNIAVKKRGEDITFPAAQGQAQRMTVMALKSPNWPVCRRP